MDIITYLNNKNIIIDEKLYRNVDRNSIDVSNQIDLIVMMHDRVMNNEITIIPRVNSTIGKDIENFKVKIKKVEKMLKSISLKNNISDLDFYIVEKGNSALDRAKKSLQIIDNDTYIDLIKRSMSNYEICLGRVDEVNLRLEKGEVLKIRTAKYISYNLIEHDLFNYIRRLKRRNFNIQVEKVIDEFIYKSCLSEKSKSYLTALCNYPFETMKLIYKYSYYDYEDYDCLVEKVNEAIKIDGDEMI